jgi:hypothetical protein
MIWRKGSCGARGRASLLEYKNRLLVHYYPVIAAGGLMVLDHATGAQARCQISNLFPLEPRGTYRTDVELKSLHEHVVIFGRESSGRYIQVIHPETGALVTHRSLGK